MSQPPDLLFEDLTAAIRQTAFEAHSYFGNGFLEKVYRNALAHRLRRKGIRVEQKKKILVHDEDGTVVGDYEADLVVEGRVLLELKAVKCLKPEHEAQLLNYLKATGIEVGLLINFGSYRFRTRRFVRSQSI